MVHIAHLKNTMKAIQENDILKMYVDETVLNFMGGQEFANSLLENEIINGTVAFIDICGFTSISETQPANKVVELLNDYFDVMVKEIIDHNGIVDKFLGDAVMAVFKGDYHLDRAIEACVKIRNAVELISTESSAGTDYKPKVSIGINSGEMVSGNIGSSTLKRLDFTVIGDVVNVAARLQASAGVGQILIAENNYEIIKDSFSCNRIGEIKMKNKKIPIVIYEVLN